jgi:hypothetical protein
MSANRGAPVEEVWDIGEKCLFWPHQRKIVQADNSTVDLTRGDIPILEVLTSHSGSTLPCEEFVRDLWNERASRRVLNRLFKAIERLREDRKLSHLGFFRGLHSRRKVGYACPKAERHSLREPLSDFPQAGALKTRFAVLDSLRSSGEDSWNRVEHERKPRIAVGRLPVTDRLVLGRDVRLGELSRYWADQTVNIVIVEAWAGVGKTALINRWLEELSKNGFEGASAIFGWSFDRQVSTPSKQGPVDAFISEGLRFFGDPSPPSGTEWNKGERLAELVASARNLVFLDALEILQTPSRDALTEGGTLDHPAITAFVKSLARHNNGLLVITTRLSLDDIRNVVDPEVQRLDLENIPEDDATAYLAEIGVRGDSRDLKTLAKNCRYHALLLTLMGKYLYTFHGGDVHQANRIRLSDWPETDKRVAAVLAGYERWLKGKPEYELLKVLAVFESEASFDALRAVARRPIIPNLNNLLSRCDARQLKLSIEALRRLRLLAPGADRNRETIDCHSLVRKFFRERLGRIPRTWRGANKRLYEFYSKTPIPERPDPENMLPLFAAVRYGCEAGRFEEAFNKIYVDKIHRGPFQKPDFGAYGDHLDTVSRFFEERWTKVMPGISKQTKHSLLNLVGYYLFVLGRVQAGVDPTRRALETAVAIHDASRAAKSSGNLSEFMVFTGDIKSAVQYAHESVKHADSARDAYHRMAQRTTLGYALHHYDDLDAAEEQFQKAEKIKRQEVGDFDYLTSIWSYRYYDCLLTRGWFGEVEIRARRTLAWSRDEGSLQDVALDCLALGRALAGRKGSAARDAAEFLDRAVETLNVLGSLPYLPRALLARSEFYMLNKNVKAAAADIDEAALICDRGGMTLMRAECDFAKLKLSIANSGAEHRELRQQLQQLSAKFKLMSYYLMVRRCEELDSKLT